MSLQRVYHAIQGRGKPKGSTPLWCHSYVCMLSFTFAAQLQRIAQPDENLDEGITEEFSSQILSTMYISVNCSQLWQVLGHNSCIYVHTYIDNPEPTRNFQISSGPPFHHH